MSTLISIGNSQGIRIPKPIIKQAHLENKELEFVVLESGLLIKPVENSSRKGWVENISGILEDHKHMEDEAILNDMLNDSDLEDIQW